MTTEIKIKKFINSFKKEFYIDFRKHQYLENQYGNTKTFNYNFASNIVTELNNQLIDLFDKQYVIYNHSMDCEALRTTSLETYIYDRVSSYFNLAEILPDHDKAQGGAK